MINTNNYSRFATLSALLAMSLSERESLRPQKSFRLIKVDNTKKGICKLKRKKVGNHFSFNPPARG